MADECVAIVAAAVLEVVVHAGSLKPGAKSRMKI